MAEVTIEATPNGPYLVTGPIELRDSVTQLPPRGDPPGSVHNSRISHRRLNHPLSIT